LGLLRFWTMSIVWYSKTYEVSEIMYFSVLRWKRRRLLIYISVVKFSSLCRRIQHSRCLPPVYLMIQAYSPSKALCSLEYLTTDKIQKLCTLACYTLSSDPLRIEYVFLVSFRSDTCSPSTHPSLIKAPQLYSYYLKGAIYTVFAIPAIFLSEVQVFSLAFRSQIFITMLFPQSKRPNLIWV
jgi:hypothetical protein